ncbi:hypothetical protein ISF_03230 [Cordyceps fumosorosea ARSEF 2679]|uniref:Uncharacterized protein n=1 Tax=Cordyceps fumosorosea (strain ARSEF 2679) TaxID=1081104 RepID=A0A168AK24_CORFA|nr:hypothetical protein ISF_03230 [Cordyceps fumosorosea ARSEF 2679]OAA68855.1 hypothetical protein ISF_03230 [Cordyceps fumosorosea ARSEF 2679]
MSKSAYYAQTSSAPPQYSQPPPQYSRHQPSSYERDDYYEEKRRYQERSRYSPQDNYDFAPPRGAPPAQRRYDDYAPPQGPPPRGYDNGYDNQYNNQYNNQNQQLQQYNRRSQSPQMAPGPLSLPVVIPQQRPGSPERGFMAAYAPMLESAGIDQRTFMSFLDEFNTAMQGNKFLAGVQVVSFGVGFTPEIITTCVATAVQMGAHVANKGYVKHKTNSTLDKFNNEVFGPRGLFCMIMKYDPIGQDPAALAEKAAAANNGGGLMSRFGGNNGQKNWLKDPVSGTSDGMNSLPSAVAPLIYMDDRRAHKEYLANDGNVSPVSDKPAAGPVTTKQKAKSAFENFNDYLDRRARAKYASENQGDILNTPLTKGFSNKFLDPNSSMNNGGLLGFISGGALAQDPETRRLKKLKSLGQEEERLREEYQQRVDQVHQQRQSTRETERQIKYIDRDYQPRFAEFRTKRRELEMGPERSIKENILYLTIVNRPSDSQLAAATDKINHGYVMPGGPQGQVL